ncbi:MAG TPA: ATP-binding protein [Candidatus Methanomethylicus sp.]|nr:ATP-binding protein [Candidatus Methanomethylicus sp.]
MSRLFRPLFTTKAKGMGMGLAVIKRIVEAHNGSINIQSRPGEGTTVTISLPQQ